MGGRAGTDGFPLTDCHRDFFIMTKRLYYDSSDTHEFDSVVEDVVRPSAEQTRPALTLLETAFYPTTAGQFHHTLWLTAEGPDSLRDRTVVAQQARTIAPLVESTATLPR